MRWFIFKIIMFFAALIFAQGAILPWAISNNIMPIWADILVITIMLILWLFILDKLASNLGKFHGGKDASSKSKTR